MQRYEIPPTWPNFFSHTPKNGQKPPSKRPKTALRSPKPQIPINQLPTPYQHPTNSYHGRSW